jgi:hypothetical protein
MTIIVLTLSQVEFPSAPATATPTAGTAALGPCLGENETREGEARNVK